jgi:hypothetical protein
MAALRGTPASKRACEEIEDRTGHEAMGSQEGFRFLFAPAAEGAFGVDGSTVWCWTQAVGRPKIQASMASMLKRQSEPTRKAGRSWRLSNRYRVLLDICK